MLKQESEQGTAVLESIERSYGKSVCAYAASKPMAVERSFRASVNVAGHSDSFVSADFIVVRNGSRSLLGR